MLRLKAWALVLALFTAAPPIFSQEFQGKVIFSVEFVEGSMEIKPDPDARPKGRTGTFYYYKEAAPGEYGPLITRYSLRNGAVVDVAGGFGSHESGVLLRKLAAISLSAFDVQKEIDTTAAKLEAEAKRNGGPWGRVMVLDGSKYRIRYDFNGVSIDYTAWNPGPDIDDLAQHSADLKKLNDVIDLFAASYGRREFGL